MSLVTEPLQLVTVWRVRRAEDGTDQWLLLGRRSPQEPQSHYRVEQDTELGRGDRLAVSCVDIWISRYIYTPCPHR